MSFPLKQYSKYADFSLSHALISQQVKDQMDAVYVQCNALLRAYAAFSLCLLFFFFSSNCRRGNSSAPAVCDGLLSTVQSVGGNFNVYDVTKQVFLAFVFAELTGVTGRASAISATRVSPMSRRISTAPTCSLPSTLAPT